MLNRVNAFLEAIDKKTEELADAADEEDITRAIRRHQENDLEHQQQQQQRQRRNENGGLTGGTAFPLPYGSSAEGNGVAAVATTATTSARGRPPSTTVQTAGLNGHLPSPAHSSSPSLRSSAQPQAATTAPVDAYAGPHIVPLSLPSKLPSFRPSLTGDGADGSGAYRKTSPQRATSHVKGSHRSGGAEAADVASRHPSFLTASPSPPHVYGATSSSAAAAAAAAIHNGEFTASAAESGPVAAALERLHSRCATLEADTNRWQQEAAAHKAQCGAARDALWKAEQEARSSRAAQRDAEQALAVYKETAQRLLDEAQQEVRRAREAKKSIDRAAVGGGGGGGNSGGEEEGGDVGSRAGLTSSSAAQHEKELNEAREVHQRMELLHAEHAALLAEVDRYQHDAAKSTAELQRVQSASRQAQAQLDALQLEVRAARESLEGEVAAHADTRAALRELQAQRQQSNFAPSASLAAASGDAADARSDDREGDNVNTSDVAQLQRALREARQRHQLLLLQVSNKQTALDSAERELADVKTRYNELARQVDDAQVEVAAGFRPPAFAAAEYGAGKDSGHRPRSVTGGAHGASAEDGVGIAFGKSTSPSINAMPDALKRTPVMLRLSRHYGVAGRAAVSVLGAIDTAALRLGRLLTQSRWVWRVVVMGYITLLQLWVVLMILASTAGD